MKQEELRKMVKLAKACNDDIYYKDFASYLEIDTNSFYNWINGYYDLSYGKANKLRDVLVDLID